MTAAAPESYKPYFLAIRAAYERMADLYEGLSDRLSELLGRAS